MKKKRNKGKLFPPLPLSMPIGLHTLTVTQSSKGSGGHRVKGQEAREKPSPGQPGHNEGEHC